MGNNPTMKSAISGVVLQALMVMIGKAVPSIGQIPNFYAICGTLLSVVTGVLYSKFAPAGSGGQAAMGGAIAGGTSSILGGALAVVTGQWPGFEAVQLLLPFLSGGVGGGIGALLGRLLPKSAQ
ncbi:MAG: hypothetical protein U0163_17610 [Gemmatimonadaceae bacterium]